VGELSETAGILTAALIVDGAVAADPVISPDGRRVAWTTSSAARIGSQVSELWLAPAGKSAEPARKSAMPVGRTPVRVASGSVRRPRWSSDSAWLFYVAGEGVLRLRIGAAGPAADGEMLLRWRGEISGLLPLADGRLVAVVAGDELTDDDERRRASGDDAMAWSERALRQHWRWHRLRLLDLASGELSVVGGLAGRHVTGMAQRPDGGPLAVVSWDGPDYDPGVFTSRLHIADLRDGTVTDLGRVGLEARSPAWWHSDDGLADGWHVAWLQAVPPGEGAAVLDIAVPPTGPPRAGRRT
jgi:hypothetical protein